jgi:hypothetical protein
LPGETGVYEFGQYTIDIPESSLRPCAGLLAKSQAAAITKGLLQEVQNMTWVHILGFLERGTKMVCIMVNLPLNSTGVPRHVFSFPLSLVWESGSVIAATVITSLEDLKKIDRDERRISFPELDACYNTVLERYAIFMYSCERALIHM